MIWRKKRNSEWGVEIHQAIFNLIYLGALKHFFQVTTEWIHYKILLPQKFNAAEILRIRRVRAELRKFVARCKRVLSFSCPDKNAGS